MLTMRRAPLAAALVALSVGLAGPRAGRAELSAYEGFDYGPAGVLLLGAEGGGGFAGPWSPGGFNASVHDHYAIATGSLEFGDLLTSGHRVEAHAIEALGGVTRALDTPLGQSETTAYLSFLLQPEAPLGLGIFEGFFGLVLEQPGTTGVFAGKPGTPPHAYVLEDRGGSNPVPTGIPAVPGQTVLVVLRIDFAADADTVTMYLDPAPGAPEPAIGTVKSNLDLGTVGALTIYSTGAFSLDELRVGESFEDVTPTNEAQVTSLAYEGFAYEPPGAVLAGADGGLGFVGAWEQQLADLDVVRIADDSLQFAGLATSGGRARLAGPSLANLSRSLAVPIGASGTVRYLSFLLRPDEPMGPPSWFGVTLGSSSGPRIFAGKRGAADDYAIEESGGGASVSSGVAAATGVTTLLVLRIVGTSGADSVTLYVDPVPGAPEPAAGTVKDDLDIGLAGTLQIYSGGGAFSIDEIRLGTTFAAVTPVPEPSPAAAAAVAVAALGLLRSARRRQTEGRRAR